MIDRDNDLGLWWQQVFDSVRFLGDYNNSQHEQGDRQNAARSDIASGAIINEHGQGPVNGGRT
jgi:hypothetical protein